jgi:hypothetical protein
VGRYLIISFGHFYFAGEKGSRLPCISRHFYDLHVSFLSHSYRPGCLAFLSGTNRNDTRFLPFGSSLRLLDPVRSSIFKTPLPLRFLYLTSVAAWLLDGGPGASAFRCRQAPSWFTDWGWCLGLIGGWFSETCCVERWWRSYVAVVGGWKQGNAKVGDRNGLGI